MKTETVDHAAIRNLPQGALLRVLVVGDVKNLPKDHILRALRQVARGTDATIALKSASNAPEKDGESRSQVQGSTDPEQIRKSAKEQEPALRRMAEQVTKDVPGATVEGSRVKEAESQDNKEQRGKPAATNIDNLGARVSAETPEGLEQVKRNIQENLPFNDHEKITNNGVNADQFALKTGKPGDANQVSELQVVPKPVADAMKETAPLYDEQKQAEVQGDQAEVERLGDQITKQHETAHEEFNKLQGPDARREGGRGESPERTGAAATAPSEKADAGRWEQGTAVLVKNPRTGLLQAGTVAHFNHGENGSARRARVSLTGGGKLDGVREDDLTRVAPIEEQPSNTGSDLESKLMQRTREEAPKLVADYLRAYTADGIPTVAVDAAKNLYPEYRKDRTATNDDVWSSAKALAGAVRDTLLARPPESGKDVVQITTGSPASGKTSSFGPKPQSQVGMRLEVILEDPETSEQTMRKIVDSGRRAVINLFYVDDPTKTVDRMISRANATGRPVNLDYMAKSYVQVPQTVAALKQQFGDKVEVNTFDNSGKPAELKSQSGSVQPALDAVKGWTEDSAKEAMYGRLKDLRREGKVTPELYRVVTEPQPAAAKPNSAGDSQPAARVGQEASV